MSDALDRVLVVEDNHTLALGVANNLRFEGYDVAVAEDGEAAIQLVSTFGPHVLVLDLMLPKVDGYEVLRRLRDAGNEVPVLILTALGDEVDRVRGFRAGADQYLTKPFSVVELMARVAALLRRRQATHAPSDGLLRFGDVTIDPERATVTRERKNVSLTPRAYQLLLSLVRHNGAVVTRQSLLREVWGYDQSVVTRTVDAHIAELRRKLEADPASPKHIVTVWKRGYRLQT